jgi:hypothetical protein
LAWGWGLLEGESDARDCHGAREGCGAWLGGFCFFLFITLAKEDTHERKENTRGKMKGSVQRGATRPGSPRTEPRGEFRERVLRRGDRQWKEEKKGD